jgi:NACHT-associated inactive restriction endonuclease
VGEPADLEGARQLAKEDPYQFQWWALGQLEARPIEQKKGADRGIDGRQFVHELDGKTRQIIFSVKAGKVSVPHVRDLIGVLDREKAEIGVFISLEEPTREMRREAASAGFYRSPISQRQAPRLQLLTIEEILSGKGVEFPGAHGNVTFKRAARMKEAPPDHGDLFIGTSKVGKKGKRARRSGVARR